MRSSAQVSLERNASGSSRSPATKPEPSSADLGGDHAAWPRIVAAERHVHAARRPQAQQTLDHEHVERRLKAVLRLPARHLVAVDAPRALVVEHQSLAVARVHPVDSTPHPQSGGDLDRPGLLAVPEPELEVLGLERGVGVGLRAQEAEQVELETARRRPHARLLGGQLEGRAAGAQLLEQDALRVGEVGGGHASPSGLLPQAPEGVLEDRVRVVASHHRLRVRGQLVRAEHVLHEPLDRAVGEPLERAGGHRLAGGQLGQQRLGREGPGRRSSRRGPVAASALSHSAAVGASSGRHVTSDSERTRTSAASSSSSPRTSSTKNDSASGLPSSSLVRELSTSSALGAGGGHVEEIALAVERSSRTGSTSPLARAIARRSSSLRNGSEEAPRGNSPS